jgi:hypothetical protein
MIFVDLLGRREILKTAANCFTKPTAIFQNRLDIITNMEGHIHRSKDAGTNAATPADDPVTKA